MRHHTREPTVLSRLSCRPPHLNFDRFHQPCLLPWRVSLLPPIHGWLLGRDRGLSSPYHVAATCPFWAAGFSLLVRLTGGFCHADYTVPRQDVDSSFLPCMCHPSSLGDSTHAGSGPSRVRRRLLWTCLGDPIHLAIHDLSCCHLRC